MKILVAGAQGQLARALLEQAHGRTDVMISALGRPQLDLTKPSTIVRAIETAAPDVVVNAAAYTAVDTADRDPSVAFSVNCEGAAALAAAAGAVGRPIIHISTDYVFDGSKQGAYIEDDVTKPIGVYGRSKLEGERAVAAANPQHVILRTAWLYSSYGHNFFRTILRLARELPELRVVADQHGNPTYALHLAHTILAIAARLGPHAKEAQPRGIFHAAGSGETNWYVFASAIVAAATPSLGMPHASIVPINTAEYPTPTRRPANSCLDCGKLARVLDLRLPPWQQGLEECIGRVAASRVVVAGKR